MEWEKCRVSAQSLIDELGAADRAGFLEEALAVAKKLRDERKFDLLDYFAEQFRIRYGDNPRIIKFQAQSLIDSGKPRTALDILAPIADSVETVEALGLMGRAWKQIFFDAQDKTSQRAIDALANSIHHYKKAYLSGLGGDTWSGLNLLALTAFAEREKIPVRIDPEPCHLARELLKSLEAEPASKRDNWYHASMAEACLGLGDLDAAEKHIGDYVQSDKTTAFALAGTLRQFTDLWQLDRRGKQEQGIVQALRAALLRHKHGQLDLSPEEVRQGASEWTPSDEQLQKILGSVGVQTFKWFQDGIKWARSVGVIRDQYRRLGTGFLVSAEGLIPSLGNEYLVMTNAHVVSDRAEDRHAISPDEATITFEAVDATRPYSFSEILWYSPVGRHDCVLLRLSEQPQGIEPLKLDETLPTADGQQRVYVIGYPGGRDLAFSFQDNVLLEHEGPPDGRPVDPAVCRLHYHAPTEPGSSGSPVFNGSAWRVIGLHHAGHERMRKLNGSSDRWPANEGVWIQSIIAAVREAQ